MGKIKVTRGSENVFADIGFDREQAENLFLRAQLMSRVRHAARGLTQRDAAVLFGVSQPRLNDLLRGKIDKFSLDALVNMLGRAGMRIELKALNGGSASHSKADMPMRSKSSTTPRARSRVRESRKPIHPGAFLAEGLSELGLSQAAFSRAIGVSPMRVSHVIKGSRPVTAELALLFGKAFGQSPQYWLNLQRQYDLELAEKSLGARLDAVEHIASAKGK